MFLVKNLMARQHFLNFKIKFLTAILKYCAIFFNLNHDNYKNVCEYIA